MVIKNAIYLILTIALLGCGPKILITEEPSIVSNIQIEADEQCDTRRD